MSSLLNVTRKKRNRSRRQFLLLVFIGGFCWKWFRGVSNGEPARAAVVFLQVFLTAGEAVVHFPVMSCALKCLNVNAPSQIRSNFNVELILLIDYKNNQLY